MLNTIPAPFKAAALQFNPKLFHKKENVNGLIAAVEALFSQGVRLVVTPEMATTGYLYKEDEGIEKLAETQNGPTNTRIAELCTLYNSYVVVGYPEKDATTGLLYNSASLIGPEGVIGTYRKMHLWVVEEHWACWGNTGVPVFKTELGNIAINICTDSTYWETARLARLAGADILAFPTNSTGGSLAALPSRAYWNQIYVIAANRCSLERSAAMKGASAIWDPLGRRIAWCAFNNDPDEIGVEDACIAEINLSVLKRVRTEYSIHGLRIPGLYTPLTHHITPCWDESATKRSRCLKVMAVASLIESSSLFLKLYKEHYDLIVLPSSGKEGNVSEEFTKAQELALACGSAVVKPYFASYEGSLVHGALVVDCCGNMVGTTTSSYGILGTGKDKSSNIFNVSGVGRVAILLADDIEFCESAGLAEVQRADVIAVIPSSDTRIIPLDNEYRLYQMPLPEEADMRYDAIAQASMTPTVVSLYARSAGIYSPDPVYGLFPTVCVGDMPAVATSITTVNNDWWINQGKLISTRRRGGYEPLIAKE